MNEIDSVEEVIRILLQGPNLPVRITDKSGQINLDDKRKLGLEDRKAGVVEPISI